MQSGEFAAIRKSLKKTQKEMAQLLGVSIKAVHSYEQGWRKIPGHVERHAFFLLSRLRGNSESAGECWSLKKCSDTMKEKCPAWEYKSGTLCWFVNGTICEGAPLGDWKEKMRVCRKCAVLAPLLVNGKGGDLSGLRKRDTGKKGGNNGRNAL